MKKRIALLLVAIIVAACIFTLAACQNGIDGKDGIDGVNGKDGVNGTNGKDGKDGKDGADGKNGENGKSTFELYKERNPDYIGDEEQWLDDIACGKLANNKYYDIITYGKNIYANVTGGTAAYNGTAMALTNCVAQLNNPVILPVCDGAEWQITLSGVLVNKDNTGTQLLTSSCSVASGRVYLGAHTQYGRLYIGVNIGGVYLNYCWNVTADTLKSDHTYAVKYGNGVYSLSVDNGAFKTFDSVNHNQTNSVNVTNPQQVSADFNAKVRAVFGQEYITLTSIGADSFAANGVLNYVQAQTSSVYGYKNLAAHPLQGKTIYHLGSSISYGASNGGVSFAEQIREITGSKMNKQTVSGTTLSNQLSNSYAARFANFTFEDKPDFLILQLSTNDFTRSEITLGSVGTQKEGFTPNTTASAIEYIITETKKKSPDTQIVIYSCVVSQGWANSHTQYSVFANTELAKLQAKYGITVVGLFGQTQLFGGIMGDDIHPNGAGYAAMFTPNMINAMTDYLATK